MVTSHEDSIRELAQQLRPVFENSPRACPIDPLSAGLAKQ